MAGAATGKITFDELCKGLVSDYVCDQDCLVTLVDTDTPEQARKKLMTKIKTLFKKIEDSSSREIEQFYIGKTFINEKATQFDAGDINTWGMDGISDRWGKHHRTKIDPKTKKAVVTKKYYAKDGMIVIAVLTKAEVPKRKGMPVVNTELYTINLEMELLEHYIKSKKDPKIANKGYGSSKFTSADRPAFVLYVAFSLTKATPSSRSRKTVPSSSLLKPLPNPTVPQKKKK